MPEVETLPNDVPQSGDIFNYGGQNYSVVHADPGGFLCLGPDGWVDAISFDDLLNEEAGELSSELSYVMPLDQFQAHFIPGEITEGVEVSNDLPIPVPPRPSNELPDTEPEPKG